MNTISTGQPATLGTYRQIALALGGINSQAVKFFDEKIASSPNGENEEVLAHETQMMYVIIKQAESAIVEVNLDALPRPLAAAVRYLAEQSWQTQSDKVYIPTSDAAKTLGIPRSTLNYWCRQGRVKAWHDGPRRGWRVDVDDAREYLISSGYSPNDTAQPNTGR